MEKVPSETDGEIFALRGIRKRFGFREVLRGVDLTGLPGSSSVIVGPNGAGKSTLLRILAGAMRPTYGDGHVAGFDLKKSAAKARARIGAVFHQSFLRPELTLDENLRFYGELYGRFDRERAAELIDVVGLSRRRGDRVRTFSQGMTQRANIARSLLHDPDLWILDEPFNGLDPPGRKLLIGLLRSFVESGRAAVVVTHDLALGREVGSRRLLLEDGLLAPLDDGMEAAEP
ncbi:MAG TPA: ABC transporter ATP-binding protein [Planctomycetota bacterium]|nr:ABC transporter ATP-binding protein [Planctomycetota bacterium]